MTKTPKNRINYSLFINKLANIQKNKNIGKNPNIFT